MPNYPVYLSSNRLQHAVWSEVEHGQFCASMYNYDLHLRDIILTTDELNQFHPQLAPAIRAHISHNDNSTHPGYARGYDVNLTLEVLCGRCINVRDLSGMGLVLTRLELLSKDNNEAVTMVAIAVELAYFEHASQQYPYVVGSRVTNDQVGISSLENSYPGWEARFNMGNELELERAELFAYTFAQSAAPVTTLPPVDLV